MTAVSLRTDKHVSRSLQHILDDTHGAVNVVTTLSPRLPLSPT